MSWFRLKIICLLSLSYKFTLIFLNLYQLHLKVVFQSHHFDLTTLEFNSLIGYQNPRYRRKTVVFSYFLNYACLYGESFLWIAFLGIKSMQWQNLHEIFDFFCWTCIRQLERHTSFNQSWVFQLSKLFSAQCSVEHSLVNCTSSCFYFKRSYSFYITFSVKDLFK